MENMRALRMRSGITMKQLGKEMGMAESTISLYETGKRSPNVQALIRFADFFKVSIDYLVGRTDASYICMSDDAISDSEQRIIMDFRKLNKQGKEYVLQSIAMAVAIYKNINIPDMENRA